MLTALPTICESSLVSYLASGYEGGYNLVKGFSVDVLELPAVVVKAGTFTMIEPGTNVFSGDVEVAIMTQIDETTDAVLAHDEAVTAIYSLLASDELLGAFNAQETGHLFGFSIDSFAQDRQDRSLVSVLSLKLHVQTLAL